MADDPFETRADAFLESLRRSLRPVSPSGETAVDRGAASRLRALLSETTLHRGLPDLARIAGPTHIGDAVYQTVAALYAIHPQECPTGNFGDVCRKLARDREDAFERRFRKILACRRSVDVCQAIVPVVRMAQREDVAIPWRQLFLDLIRWDSLKWQKSVRIKWTQHYFDVPAENEIEADAATAPVQA